MMASWHENGFRITYPLWEESTADRQRVGNAEPYISIVRMSNLLKDHPWCLRYEKLLRASNVTLIIQRIQQTLDFTAGTKMWSVILYPGISKCFSKIICRRIQLIFRERIDEISSQSDAVFALNNIYNFWFRKLAKHKFYHRNDSLVAEEIQLMHMGHCGPNRLATTKYENAKRSLVWILIIKRVYIRNIAPFEGRNRGCRPPTMGHICIWFHIQLYRKSDPNVKILI